MERTRKRAGEKTDDGVTGDKNGRVGREKEREGRGMGEKGKIKKGEGWDEGGMRRKRNGADGETERRGKG